MRNFWTEFSLAIRALVVIVITIAVCATTADTPLLPPAKVSVMSPNRRFRAVSDPNVGTRLEDAKQHKVLWSFLIGIAIYSSLMMASISLRSTMG